MSATPRLSALDTSFLDVETPTAHMHVGWAATFSPPEDDEACDFESLSAHLASRLGRAPRYRQKLAPVPLGVTPPAWVDDPDFDPRRHIRHARGTNLASIVDDVMSQPLDRDRPLWEIWIAPELDDGRLGMVGKAHHCMVDGMAAVELALLLLDPSSTPVSLDGDGSDWSPEPEPEALELFARGTVDRVRDEVGALVGWTREHVTPRRVLGLPADALRLTASVGRTVLPIAPPTLLNQHGSSLRHLAVTRRPLDDLREVKRRFGATINDVVLAASAGTLRRYMLEHGDDPVPLKAMVPVSVRADDDDGEFGNRISFMFVELPCDDANPGRRLEAVHAATLECKELGDPERSDTVLQAASHLPRVVQKLMSRAVASPLLFNLVVSNIPGPRTAMYMCGHELEEAYPIVPLADSHALSIGVTTVKDDACFGLYADRKTLPDADKLAGYLDAELDELLTRSPRPLVPV
jgi:WS/DGAT/MGAT family acyltransferase